MKLAILIPTTPDRDALFERVTNELTRQVGPFADEVCIIHLRTEKGPSKQEPRNTGPTTGAKRNELIQAALNINAEAIAFFDSDDMPGPTYIQRGIEFVNSGMDCAELLGQIYWSGKPGKPFHHSLIYDHWWEDNKTYFRTINHLNFVRLDKVKDIKYPDQVFGEDGVWSERVHAAGVLKTMYPIPEVIYHYYVGEPKHAL